MKIWLDLSESRVARIRIQEEKRLVDELTGPRPLPLIDEILKRNKLKLIDIEEFDSFPGPGSFTGLKVGATIANILNWQIGKERTVKPVYEPKDRVRTG